MLELFLELRVVKSDEEVRRMRVAAQATQRALGVAIETLRPGMTGLGGMTFSVVIQFLSVAFSILVYLGFARYARKRFDAALLEFSRGGDKL